MSVVNKLGDRLLGMFLPSVTASAGCPYECWYAQCTQCSSRRCCINAQCNTVCGSCVRGFTAGVSC